MSEYTVIDVSTYQGKVDWAAVKPNIYGAIIRIGYGNDQTDQDDNQAVRNITECERLGIPWGAYLYSYATNSSMLKSEYEHMKRMLKGHKPVFPWYIDLEESSCAGFAKQAAKDWYNLCKADGVKPGIYTFVSYYNSYVKGVGLTDASWWIASFGTNNGKPQTKPNIGIAIDGWQYTSVGKVKGISGNVDMSIFYKDFTGGSGMWKQEWVYYNPDGTLKKNAWQKDSKGWCYLDGDGKAVKNKWVKWKGDWYYLKNDYHMAANEYANDSHGKCWLGKDGKWDGKYY